MKKSTGPIFALCVMFAINMMNFYDRLILGAVGEDIRTEWKLSDTDLAQGAAEMAAARVRAPCDPSEWEEQAKKYRSLVEWRRQMAATGEKAHDHQDAEV